MTDEDVDWERVGVKRRAGEGEDVKLHELVSRSRCRCTCRVVQERKVVVVDMPVCASDARDGIWRSPKFLFQ